MRSLAMRSVSPKICREQVAAVAAGIWAVYSAVERQLHRCQAAKGMQVPGQGRLLYLCQTVASHRSFHPRHVRRSLSIWSAGGFHSPQALSLT